MVLLTIVSECGDVRRILFDSFKAATVWSDEMALGMDTTEARETNWTIVRIDEDRRER